MKEHQRKILEIIGDLLDENENRSIGSIMATAMSIRTVSELFKYSDEQLLKDLERMYGRMYEE